MVWVRCFNQPTNQPMRSEGAAPMARVKLLKSQSPDLKLTRRFFAVDNVETRNNSGTGFPLQKLINLLVVSIETIATKWRLQKGNRRDPRRSATEQPSRDQPGEDTKEGKGKGRDMSFISPVHSLSLFVRECP